MINTSRGKTKRYNADQFKYCAVCYKNIRKKNQLLAISSSDAAIGSFNSKEYRRIAEPYRNLFPTVNE